ncbi:MAG: acetate/propionate family kinase [Betaproteobacteria bacterium]|nr:acetate/propionate family kinase [Betaproteobacteria bacterium]
MARAILVVNAGSSSIKFAVFPLEGERLGSLACKGLVDRIGPSTGHFSASDAQGARLADQDIATAPGEQLDHRRMFATALDWLERHSAGLSVIAAGHRVVHGAERYSTPVVIGPEVMAELKRLIPLAPLHQPHNVAAIEALAQVKPGLPQVACFDTGFHRSQPPLAQAFALPRPLSAEGLKRYGFHGLSYEYIASVLPDYLGDQADGRVIVLHLGNGASMCAMKQRRSIATTMGFTALDGLMMGTRCGNLDPGVLLYLMQEKKMDAEAITDLLYRKSGLLGVSGGIASDMRTLLETEDDRAGEAIDLFVYRIAREIGSLAACLEGLDALVFTGGIGEHADTIREMVCEAAEWLGVQLDEPANLKGGPRISKEGSAASAWVIPTDEEAVIARHTYRLLNSGHPTRS